MPLVRHALRITSGISGQRRWSPIRRNIAVNGLRRLAGVTLIAAASASGWVLSPAAIYAADRPEVVHEQFVTTGADLGVVNICGDLADFHF